MSLLCFFNRHKPSVQSITRRKEGDYAALCDSCGTPIAKHGDEPWRAQEPQLGRTKARNR